MKKERDENKRGLNFEDFIIINLYFWRVVQVYVLAQGEEKEKKSCIMDGEGPEKKKATELHYRYFKGSMMLHLQFTYQAEQRK